VKPDAGPATIRQPGHIFPLVAKPGGVLKRAGHTEAGVDLARMAGLEPAAVIVEIMNPDGTMARRPQLETFAEQHGLAMGTIADLIEYRSLHEQSISKAAEHTLDTAWGAFTLHIFRDTLDDSLHYALSLGDVAGHEPIAVRVQPIQLLRDIIGTQLPDGGPAGWSYRSAMSHISDLGRGIVVLVTQQLDADSVLEDIARFAGAEPRPERPQNYRLIGTGAQILRQLGVEKMQLLSAPLHFNALSGFNLEISEFVPHP
jgi:3,4-dihydroxy 2-butanone 4-phosphate synthase/GTP cyclohydrolase II